MPTRIYQTNPKQWQKSWLAHISQELRLKVYEHSLADGFILHCNTIGINEHRFCGLPKTAGWTKPEIKEILDERDERDDLTKRPFAESKQESTLSKLLRTCRAVNKEVSQLCLSLVSRRREMLEAASCVNHAIWWRYSDLRLVDPDPDPELRFDEMPRFGSLRGRAKKADVLEWRIGLIHGLAKEFVRVRGAYGEGREVVSQRVHLYDFSWHGYGSRSRRFEDRDMRPPSQIFVLDLAVFLREGQWFGVGDLVKCVVAVEIVLQVLKVGLKKEVLGAGTRDMCRVYERPGVQGAERLVIFEAEGWEVAAWNEESF